MLKVLPRQQETGLCDTRESFIYKSKLASI